MNSIQIEGHFYLLGIRLERMPCPSLAASQPGHTKLGHDPHQGPILSDQHLVIVWRSGWGDLISGMFSPLLPSYICLWIRGARKGDRLQSPRERTMVLCHAWSSQTFLESYNHFKMISIPKRLGRK